MGLRTASFFALIGMLLLTVLYLAGFVRDLTSFFNNTVAALAVLESAIHLLAALTLTLFLLVFYRTHA